MPSLDLDRFTLLKQLAVAALDETLAARGMGVRRMPADAGRHRRTSSRGRRPRSAEVIAKRNEGERGVLVLAVVRPGVVHVSWAAVVRAQSGPPLREESLLPLRVENAITNIRRGIPERGS